MAEPIDAEAAGTDFLRPRMGQQPRTQRRLPHLQLDQWPPVAMIEGLIERCVCLPNVRTQQSRMASPETRALCLPDELAQGPADAFIDDHEFCHLHPPPGGGLHLTLPYPVRQRVIQSGWAEQHPAVQGGFLPQTLVLVYAPRNEDELEIVTRLVGISCKFARGCL